MMDLLRLGKRQRVVMRLLSPQLWKFGVHWYGRTFLCPRPAAPTCRACLLERGKYRGFAIGAVKQPDSTITTGLIELPQTAVEGLVAKGVDFQDCAGVTFAMERLAPPRGWSISAVERVSVDPSPIEGLSMSLDVLFALPSRVGDDGLISIATDWREWLGGHAPVLAERIRKACQNGSHQIAQDARS